MKAGRWTRGLVVAVAGMVLGAAPAARAEMVLGADAARPVKAWTSKLGTLKPERIEIQQGRVVVHLGEACRLLVSHPSRASCPMVRSVGNAVVCWDGGACPPESEREAALTQAGPLALPWIDLSSGGTEPETVDPKLEAVRAAVAEALSKREPAGVAKALEPLLRGKQTIRVVEWPSLLPVAAAVGLGREAFEMAMSPQLAELGPTRLSALRVAILRGPVLGAAVAEAILDRQSACGLVPVAKAWSSVGAVASAASLAGAAQQANPDCFEAWAVAVEAQSRLGDTAEAARLADAARAHFGEDPRFGQVADAFLWASGRVEELRERLEAKVAAGDRTEEVLLQLIGIYNLDAGRTERATDLARQVAERPDDMLVRLFAGPVLLGDRDYPQAMKALDGLEKAFPKLAQVHAWTAIAAFHLGQLDKAKAAIAKAAKMAPRDPEIAYLQAEILRDVDRKRALDALERHVALLDELGIGPGSAERKRARTAREALEQCGKDLAEPCAGAWEHIFDSVAADARGAAEKARMDAEEKAKAAEGGAGGSGEAPAGGGSPDAAP